jgi:hypothetical protein
MADVISLLIEIAFAVSLLGFITIVILVPTKKVVESGKAGKRMESPFVPAVLLVGGAAAFSMFPLSLLSGSNIFRIAGIVSSVILIVAYVAIYMEHRAMKKYITHVHTPLETVDAVPAHADQMTVECPRCGKHLTIQQGANMITCPHCGLSGSL